MAILTWGSRQNGLFRRYRYCYSYCCCIGHWFICLRRRVTYCWCTSKYIFISISSLNTLNSVCEGNTALNEIITRDTICTVWILRAISGWASKIHIKFPVECTMKVAFLEHPVLAWRRQVITKTLAVFWISNFAWRHIDINCLFRIIAILMYPVLAAGGINIFYQAFIKSSTLN